MRLLPLLLLLALTGCTGCTACTGEPIPEGAAALALFAVVFPLGCVVLALPFVVSPRP